MDHHVQDDSAEQSMATLMLLARGRPPSWRTPTSQPPLTAQQKVAPLSLGRTKNNWRSVLYLWVICSCIKILLFPAYKSDDFYVHRHWKAVTRNLDVSQWYFDDRYVKTVHTLDYPPGFAVFEYFWGKVVGDFLLTQEDDPHCLALLPDAVKSDFVSSNCVAFLRSTVILSDLIYWIGAYSVSTVVSSNVLFLLLVFHPAMLWLDHVHFQYNGMLLGILLLSLGCLMHANNNSSSKTGSNGSSSKNKDEQNGRHLAAAALFALLLTLKHLYMTCGLWYAVYLFRRYCCYSDGTVKVSRKRQRTLCVSWKRFIKLVVVTGIVFAAPFLLFARSLFMESDTNQEFIENGKAWMQQLVSRLFPFGRGLVHEYWAGNIWAFYTAAVKVLSAVARRYNSVSIELMEWLQFRAVTPGFTALCMLAAQIPGLRLALRAAADRSNTLLLQSFTYTAFSTFLFQYHAHEKAILTALIPCTVWAAAMQKEEEEGKADRNARNARNRISGRTMTATELWSFLWEFSAVALLALFPLLFQPQELLLKLCSYTAYLATLQFIAVSNDAKPRAARTESSRCSRKLQRWIFVVGITGTIVQLEMIPIQSVFGRYEFVPLALTSLVCASGLLILFAQLFYWTYKATS